LLDFTAIVPVCMARRQAGTGIACLLTPMSPKTRRCPLNGKSRWGDTEPKVAQGSARAK